MSSLNSETSKFTLFAVALSAFVFAVLIPVLEINDTHLFNPQWPEHARLHEAWQLICNAALSVLSVSLVWHNKSPRTGIIIALIIGVSFLISWATGSAYGGSMLHTDGTQMAVGGINVAVIVVLMLTALLLISLFKTPSSTISRERV